MTDEELIAQAASLIPVYVDGFGAFRKTNGVFRAVGFVADTGAVLNLVMLLEGAQQANVDARRTLDGKPLRAAKIGDVARPVH